MSALAALLTYSGCLVHGSDIAEEFFTDGVLEAAGIEPCIGFSADHINPETTLLIYSTAYAGTDNPEIQYARQSGIPLLTYPEFLGAVSQEVSCALVVGTHGKTGTTALTSHLLHHEGRGFFSIFGAALAGGGEAFMATGTETALFEACEYQRHFLVFDPDIILITNVELDHPDYFRDEDDVRSAFIELLRRLPHRGSVIYCADDPGAAYVVRQVTQERPDLLAVPYGTDDTVEGEYRITAWRVEAGYTVFKLVGSSEEFRIPAPGRHQALNATGAMALTRMISELIDDGNSYGSNAPRFERLRSGLKTFPGCLRRSEIIGEVQGIIFMDDFAHHPTEIRSTLQGIRERYPEHRVIIDFVPHTFTRTERLYDQFIEAFSGVHTVLIHPVYGSQREIAAEPGREISLSRRLVDAIPSAKLVLHDLDAREYLREVLKPGDLFITMGAGNNRSLGLTLFEEFAHKEQHRS